MDILVLKQITEDYLEEAKAVMKKERPLAGIFGLRGSIRNDPCHERFYEKLSLALKNGDFDPYDVVRFLVYADRDYECANTIKVMLTAIQGLAIPYASKLTPEQKKEFADYFDANIRRVDRVPVQEQLVKALKT